MASAEAEEVEIEHFGGRAPLLLICEHASNAVPAAYDNLGLSADALTRHTAWDPGAHRLARQLAITLDAPLVAATVSRLVIDPNRAHDAHDLAPVLAEGEPVPGNSNVTAEERAHRIRAFHDPFHATIQRVLAARSAIQALISIHTFTPVLFGKARPWQAGVLHDDDRRLADPLLDALRGERDLNVGDNEPYAPSDGVYYTMTRHAQGRATAMIEVRNELLRDEAGIAAWSARLARAIRAALHALGHPIIESTQRS